MIDHKLLIFIEN